jgi:MFS family permease
LTASLAPRIRGDFAFGDSSLGLAVAIFYAVCAIVSTPCGRLVDRIGADWGIRIGAATTVACGIGVAALAHSTAELIALLLVGGIGNALAGPAVSALLRREVSGHRQGLAFGAQQSGAPLGALLAGLALPAIAMESLSAMSSASISARVSTLTPIARAASSSGDDLIAPL